MAESEPANPWTDHRFLASEQASAFFEHPARLAARAAFNEALQRWYAYADAHPAERSEWGGPLTDWNDYLDAYRENLERAERAAMRGVPFGGDGAGVGVSSDRYAIGPRHDDEALAHVRAFADGWHANGIHNTVICHLRKDVTLTIGDLKTVLERLDDVESELEFVRERAHEH